MNKIKGGGYSLPTPPPYKVNNRFSVNTLTRNS